MDSADVGKSINAYCRGLLIMLVIGLTGGIGSGKTIVANLFAALGVPIIDADAISREVTERDSFAQKEIVHYFGKTILKENGELNRSKLRSIIFKDADKKMWLEQLLHPLIVAEMKERISPLTSPYCIAVIPLLLEVGTISYINRILVVDTAEETQIARVSARDNIAKADAITILKTQIERKARLKGADDIIINDGLIADLKPQVEKMHIFYTKMSGA